MTELDERVTDVLSGMPMLPAPIGRDVLARLGRIERAMREGVMEEGTILLQFRDLSREVVVLALRVQRHFAFLDVSTSEDAIAVSHGYSFCMGEKGVSLVIDKLHHMTEVDHGALAQAWIETEKMLTYIDQGRNLMRTHPVFARIEPND